MMLRSMLRGPLTVHADGVAAVAAALPSAGRLSREHDTTPVEATASTTVNDLSCMFVSSQ
jgi:hypothetical protein